MMTGKPIFNTEQLPPGAPRLMTPAPAELVISTFGDFDARDGGVIRIVSDSLIFSMRFGETECEIGISLENLLEAIGHYNKQTGS